MWTEARPVRVEARALRKSATALSMRFFRVPYVSLSAGIAAITDGAINTSLGGSTQNRRNKYVERTKNYTKTRKAAVHRGLVRGGGNHFFLRAFERREEDFFAALFFDVDL